MKTLMLNALLMLLFLAIIAILLVVALEITVLASISPISSVIIGGGLFSVMIIYNLANKLGRLMDGVE